ncbi:MAG TPA: hypothetical protein VD967_02235 [Candidatus Paceibacterota bacterium]|nr:hypothetical protein [Candidatus Paceibacterota bacterium]
MKKGFDEEKDREEGEFGKDLINLGEDDAEVPAAAEEDPFSLGTDLEEEEDDTPFGFGPLVEE